MSDRNYVVGYANETIAVMGSPPNSRSKSMTVCHRMTRRKAVEAVRDMSLLERPVVLYEVVPIGVFVRKPNPELDGTLTLHECSAAEAQRETGRRLLQTATIDPLNFRQIDSRTYEADCYRVQLRNGKNPWYADTLVGTHLFVKACGSKGEAFEACRVRRDEMLRRLGVRVKSGKTRRNGSRRAE